VYENSRNREAKEAGESKVIVQFRLTTDCGQQLIGFHITAEAMKTKQALLIQWLAPPEISSSHLSACNQQEEGTGRWLLEGEQFVQWKTSSQQCLWLVGDGMSVHLGMAKVPMTETLCYSRLRKDSPLVRDAECHCPHSQFQTLATLLTNLRSSSVIEELKLRKAKGQQRGSIAYVYFTFTDARYQDTSAFLKSMLCQLFLKDSVHPVVENLQKRCDLDPPSTRDLQHAFLACLESRGGCQGDEAVKAEPIYLILDGLDEVPYGPDRVMILGLLGYLCRQAYAGLHLLLSSRPERDIECEIQANPGWNTFRYPLLGTQHDLSIYVIRQIDSTPKLVALSAQTKESIKDRLIEGAGSMYVLTL
jgi:hypothetical protein